MESKVITDCNNCPIKPMKTEHQYKATRLWNDLVRSFRTHMCCKKHRKHLRTYHNCFTATAAVDVLHAILKANNNFNFTVSRLQAVKLLRKFLKRHVIEDVHGKWGTEDFSEGSGLYRFPNDNTGSYVASTSRTIRILKTGSLTRKVRSRPQQVYSPPVVKRFSVIPANNDANPRKRFRFDV